MPKAPLYNGPQVTPGQLQGGMLSTNVADMSGIGRGLSQLGQGVNDIYLAEKQKAEDEQLTQSLSKARDLQTSEMYDPENGIMYKQGADLYGVAQDRLTQFKTKLNGIREGLGSTRVKQQFDRAADSLWQEYNRSVQMRIGSEREKTSNAVYSDYVRSETTATGNALSHRGTHGSSAGSYLDLGEPSLTGEGGTVPGDFDPFALPGSTPKGGTPSAPKKTSPTGLNLDEIDATLFRISLAVQDRVKSDPGGFPQGREAAAKDLYTKDAGKAVSEWMEILLAQGRSADAKALFERHGDLIPVEQKGSMIKAVESGVFIDDAQASADALIGEVGKNNDPLPDQEHNAIKRAEEIHKGDAKMRDEVTRRINAHYDQERHWRQGAILDTFKDYYERLNKGERFDKLFKEREFHLLDPSHQEQIKKLAEERERGKDLGEDLGKVYRYEIMAKSNDPAVREAFRTLDLTKQNLTPKEFSKVSKLQFDLQEANLNQAKEAEQKGVRTVHQISEDTAKTFLKDPKDRYMFQQQLEEQVRVIQQREKRPVHPDEVQKIANDLLLKKAEGYLSRDKYIFELTPEEINDPSAMIAWDKIPEQDKARIRTQWQKNKRRAPEKEEIQRQYFDELRMRQQTRGIPFQK